MDEKVSGYGLLFVGLALIAFAVFSVYTVFTGRAQPVNVFSFDSISVPLSSLMQGAGEASLPTGGAELELFKADALNKTTNTFAHLFLMGFVASAGFKVATLGTNLIRPIVVKVNDQRLKSSILDPK